MPTAQPDNVVYAKALLAKGHGYPLWFPEPASNLPKEYHSQGIQLGDVILLTADGGFDYLFNIFADKNSPINVGRVPDGFDPLDFDPQFDTSHRKDWQNPGAHISNLKAKRLRIQGDASVPGALLELGAGIEFKASKSSGAILVCPEGAARFEYVNRSRLREYLDANINAWFDHANGAKFGRCTQDLYIVTGCDKATESGVAAFATHQAGSSSSRKIAFNFEAVGVNLGVSYSWSTVSSASTRITPVTFRDSNGDRGKCQNHCVFVRGYMYTKSCRSIIRGRTSIRVGDDFSKARPWKAPRRTPSSSATSSSSSQQTSSTMSTSSSQLSPLHTNSSSPSYVFSDHHHSDPMSVYHPSHIINRHILGSDEDLDYAVTHDDVWSCLSDNDLWDADVLLRSLTGNAGTTTPHRAPLLFRKAVNDLGHRFGFNFKQPPSVHSDRKRALLVGIAYVDSPVYSSRTQSHVDVDAMQDLLINLHGYSPHEITVMKDSDDVGSHLWPTRENLERELSTFIDEDTTKYFFLFCGHSDDNHIITSDGSRIGAQSLQEWLVEPLKKTSQLVGILDTCASLASFGDKESIDGSKWWSWHPRKPASARAVFISSSYTRADIDESTSMTQHFITMFEQNPQRDLWDLSTVVLQRVRKQNPRRQKVLKKSKPAQKPQTTVFGSDSSSTLVQDDPRDELKNVRSGVRLFEDGLVVVVLDCQAMA